MEIHIGIGPKFLDRPLRIQGHGIAIGLDQIDQDVPGGRRQIDIPGPTCLHVHGGQRSAAGDGDGPISRVNIGESDSVCFDNGDVTRSAHAGIDRGDGRVQLNPGHGIGQEIIRGQSPRSRHPAARRVQNHIAGGRDTLVDHNCAAVDIQVGRSQGDRVCSLEGDRVLGASVKIKRSGRLVERRHFPSVRIDGESAIAVVDNRDALRHRVVVIQKDIRRGDRRRDRLQSGVGDGLCPVVPDRSIVLVVVVKPQIGGRSAKDFQFVSTRRSGGGVAIVVLPLTIEDDAPGRSKQATHGVVDAKDIIAVKAVEREVGHSAEIDWRTAVDRIRTGISPGRIDDEQVIACRAIDLKAAPKGERLEVIKDDIGEPPGRGDRPRVPLGVEPVRCERGCLSHRGQVSE